MKNKILLAFLLLICQFANAQTRPAAGTTTFASFNPAGVSVILPVVSSGTTTALFPNGILGFDFAVTNSSSNNVTGTTNAGNGVGKIGIRLNALITALSTAVVKSNDGSEFKLNSVNMLVNTNPDGQPINFTITGYKDGAVVSGATKTIATSGVNTSYNLFDVSTMSQFNNIDEFRFTHASAALITRVVIDDIDVTAIPPTITSSTYDASTGVLNVTGTNMGTGTTIDVSKLTFTGIGGATRTLSTTNNVTVTNATSFSVTLAGTDKTAVNALINQNGTSESGGTAYNLGVANNWITNYATGADLTGNPVTVSNYTPPCTAPTITSNPPNRTICVGHNTTFSAAATGATDYQWQVDVNASGTYTNLSNVAPYSNVTTITLTVTGATAAMSGYRYRMVAINGVSTCFANTNYGILTISNPTLTATQNNVTTFGGNDGTATVAATGGISSYSYTWSPNVSTAATATGLTAGTYTVTVRDEILCPVSKTFTILQPPNIPSSTVITSSGFTINWGAVTGATSYKLDVSTSNTFSSFVGVYQDFTVSGTSQVISGLAANTIYYFRVRAVSADAGTTNSSGTGSRTTLPLNTAPVANNDVYSVTQGGSLIVPVGTGILANDTDVDGDALTASLITWPENSSSFIFRTDGSFTYYHDGFSTTADVFTYRANDGKANSNIATVTINVIDPVTVSSITRVSAATTNANSVDFTVTFSGAVTGVNVSNFSLTSSDLSSVSISAVSGSGATRTVTVNTGTGTGTIRLNLQNVTGISPTVITAVPYTGGQSYTIDRTAPTLTAVTIASNNATTSLAKTGDVVTVSFTASENIASPTVTIAGASATISGSGTTYTATRTLLVTDAQGTVPFSIAFSDVAGNAGTPISATTNSSSITFDRTAPAAPVVLTVANGTTTTIATPIITGTAEANATISVAIDGTQVGTTTANGSNNWIFPISTPLANGSHTVRATATDGAGNISANSNTNTFTVNINPTITATGLLSTLTTTYGTASTSTQFTVSGTNLSTAILVTAPTYFEVSTDDITFNNTVTVGTSGTVSGTVYVRLKATAPASTYIGNIVLSSTEASDETISTASSTVNTKALTVTAAAITKIYNNNNTAIIGFNAFDTSTGLVGSDVVGVTYTNATYDNENVGTNKVISITGLALTGASKDNYFLNAFTANGSITAKPITVVLNASPLIAKGYNKSNTAVLAAGNYALNNVETDDAVTVTGTATYADENVGIDKIVTVNSFVLAGAESGNYNLTTTSATTTGNITAKPITVILNASPLITKVYNNSNTAILAAGNYTLNNVETGDAVTVNGTASYADENVGIGKVVTVNSFVLTGAESSNYSVSTTSAATTGNITTKPITVSLSTSPLITKVYNNSNAAVLATGNYTLNNVETGDAVTVTGTATYADENIGIDKVVTVNSFVLAGAERSNYNLTTTSAATTGNITAKPITVTLNASPLITKVYNNSNLAVLAAGNYTLNNVETGDAVTVTGTATYADKHVGVGKVVTVNSFILAGAESNNYTLTTTSTTTTGNITVKPITLSLNALPLITKGYNNSNTAILAAGNYTLNNVETGDAVTVTGTATYADKNVGNGKVVNVSTFVLAGTDKDNYNLTTATATTTGSITPVALTITAENKEKFVGTANPVLTPKFDGFINGETNAVLTTQPVVNTTATINSPIGSYPIIASGAVATNYVISYIDGQLIVKAGAPTSVNLTNATLYENRPSGTLAGTLNSTSDDPNATFTYSLVTGTGSADNAKFAIVNNELRTAQILDYEAQAQYNLRVRSTTQYGFSLDQTFVIQLNDVNETPTLGAISNQTICYTNSQQVVALANITAGPEVNQTTTLTVTNSNPSLFSSFAAVKTAGTNGEFRYIVALGASGTATIHITVKDSGGINNGGVDTFTQTFTVTVNPLPVVSISSNIGLSISKGLTAQLTATGGTIYTWANANGIISGQNTAILTVRPSLNTTYTVTVTNETGCTTTKSITLIILDDYVMISGTNILTPNGDGKNDFLVIRNIDLYPNNELKIYDISGRIIYSKKTYNNDWGGTLNGSPLARGTYYYVIDFGDGKARKKGFITIVRD